MATCFLYFGSIKGRAVFLGAAHRVWLIRPSERRSLRRRIVSGLLRGALIQEDLAWLRDESFDLDLIGFDATELERLLALADGEAGSDDAEDEFPSRPRIRSQCQATSGSWAPTGCCAVTARCWRTSGTLDGQFAGMTFYNRPYNVDYVNTPNDKPRGKHRAILNDDLGGDLAGATRLDR
jgi:hypothetical protein